MLKYFRVVLKFGTIFQSCRGDIALTCINCKFYKQKSLKNLFKKKKKIIENKSF